MRMHKNTAARCERNELSIIPVQPQVGAAKRSVSVCHSPIHGSVAHAAAMQQLLRIFPDCTWRPRTRSSSEVATGSPWSPHPAPAFSAVQPPVGHD